MDNISPQSEEKPHVVQGEPGNGEPLPVETKEFPPFIVQKWEPPSKIARMVREGITVTLQITPYLLTFWILAPDDVRYEIRKQARWIPYAIKYATWWLKQNA
jgi:hypothetical protein